MFFFSKFWHIAAKDYTFFSLNMILFILPISMKLFISAFSGNFRDANQLSHDIKKGIFGS